RRERLAIAPHHAFLHVEGDGGKVLGKETVLDSGNLGGELGKKRTVREVVQERLLDRLTGKEVLGAGTGVGIRGCRSLPLDQAELAALATGPAFHSRFVVGRGAFDRTGGRRTVLARVDGKAVLRAARGGDHGRIGHEHRGSSADSGSGGAVNDLATGDRSRLQRVVQHSEGAS